MAGVLGISVEGVKDPEGVVRGAIERSGRSFKEFLAGALSPLLVVVNDATRPTPSADVLRALRADLDEWLLAPRHSR